MLISPGNTLVAAVKVAGGGTTGGVAVAETAADGPAPVITVRSWIW